MELLLYGELPTTHCLEQSRCEFEQSNIIGSFFSRGIEQNIEKYIQGGPGRVEDYEPRKVC